MFSCKLYQCLRGTMNPYDILFHLVTCRLDHLIWSIASLLHRPYHCPLMVAILHSPLDIHRIPEEMSPNAAACLMEYDLIFFLLCLQANLSAWSAYWGTTKVCFCQTVEEWRSGTVQALISDCVSLFSDRNMFC